MELSPASECGDRRESLRLAVSASLSSLHTQQLLWPACPIPSRELALQLAAHLGKQWRCCYLHPWQPQVMKTWAIKKKRKKVTICSDIFHWSDLSLEKPKPAHLVHEYSH